MTSIMSPVYQTRRRWLPRSAIEFSNTSACSMITESDATGHCRKRLQHDRSHNPCREACRSA
jgi:hypothetical protein